MSLYAIEPKFMCEIRIPPWTNSEIVINPFKILGFDVKEIGILADNSRIYEVINKPREK